MTTDLLTDSALVCSAAVELGSLAVAGIRIGSASHQIPRERIVDVTCSPIVRSYRTGPQFFDEVGKQLSLSQVIDSVIHADGTVHFREEASFKIANGIVVGFALYGSTLSRRFAHLKSFADFVAAFGAGCDRVVQEEADGDLFAYDLYYFNLHKLARWSVMSQTLEVVHWGVYDRDACENTPRTSLMEQHLKWSLTKTAGANPRERTGENTVPVTLPSQPESDFCCGQALQESDYGYGPGHFWTVCPRCGDTQVYGFLTAE